MCDKHCSSVVNLRNWTGGKDRIAVSRKHRGGMK
jgi:hypothetical protein